ncbi:S9 family peptidase [Spirilliplanes yamanashiensis]|uniref:S9 family peptidase n=1 Tax=Spirilliplanes yamanashiensis TaxID=42233 RepID=UPI001951AFA3|nr:prolyl oligopeptidase family serine peptidase [Spirilliplanes yamanashiensis]MDP9814060.1 dipeptidyl-peptidase-4 [Spirilliplanes yamanashiensis]
MDYPELADRTDRLRHGAPHAVAVGGDGARVSFLRTPGATSSAAGLWTYTVASGAERLVADPGRLIEGEPEPLPGGIRAYATDTAGRIAAFAYAERLFRADLATGEVVEVVTEAPVTAPAPDPTGTRIAYLAGGTALRVVGPDGTDELLAGEPGVAWGDYRWSPDGRTILARRTDAGRLPRLRAVDADHTFTLARPGGPLPRATLHLLDLDGGWVDVHWDRETYPYVAAARWADGGPLITVLRRLQQHGLVLSVDPRTGETQVHAELADARWVEPVAGTPRHLPDGRVLVGGELAHDGYDARCLFADGSLLTPPGLYVRRVVGVLPRLGSPAGTPDLIVEATDGDPAEQHVLRIRGGADAVRLTSAPGRHVAAVGGDLLAIGSASPSADGTTWTLYRGESRVGALTSHATAPGLAPAPVLDRVTDRALPAGVLYPARHVTGRRLPVLLDVGAGPGHQSVLADRAAWLERQWFADAGYAVVSVDGRGTPGVAPSFEKVVHRRLADVLLADQADALHALAGKHPDLDLTRVAARGTGLGGWLALLAALTRPDLVRCAVARTPVTDWTLAPNDLAERYLGLPEESPGPGEVYDRHCLLGLPASPSPVLLVHGLADETIVPAHTLDLSASLLAAGHPHAVLPVRGAGALTDGYDALLLPQERAFLTAHVPPA